jgi:hypothetical protein
MTTETRINMQALIDEAFIEGRKLPADQQFHVEYALQSVGSIAADLNRIEAWVKAVHQWAAEGKLLTDGVPRASSFVGK